MPWAQSVKAFQKRFETGNSLSLGLADPRARAVVSPIGPILVRSKSPESVPLPTFFNFQRTVYKICKIIRSSPTDVKMGLSQRGIFFDQILLSISKNRRQNKMRIHRLRPRIFLCAICPYHPSLFRMGICPGGHRQISQSSDHLYRPLFCGRKWRPGDSPAGKGSRKIPGPAHCCGE